MTKQTADSLNLVTFVPYSTLPMKEQDIYFEHQIHGSSEVLLGILFHSHFHQTSNAPQLSW